MPKLIKKVLLVLIIVVLVPITLGAVFITTLSLTEYRPNEVEPVTIEFNQSNQISTGDIIKIMTFNIGYASLSKTEDFVMDGGVKSKPDSKTLVTDNLDGILSIVNSYQADIYFFQEVDIASNRSFLINQLSLIQQSLPNQSSAYAPNFRVLFVPFPFSIGNMIGKVESGIVTTTSFETTESVRIQLPGEFAWPIRLANLKRALIVTRLPIANSMKELVLINGHLSAYDDGSMREQEMAKLREIMMTEQLKGNYVIVGGDFNQTFPNADGLYPITDTSNYVAPVIPSSFLPSQFTYAIDLTKPTCRLLNQPYNPLDPNTQYYLIDGFIVSSNILVHQIETIDHDFEYSDHNPVTMSFELIP
jgi:endonuclease/exonuclease/phosphatase family metal-dependent hydrolase